MDFKMLFATSIVVPRCQKYTPRASFGAKVALICSSAKEARVVFPAPGSPCNQSTVESSCLRQRINSGVLNSHRHVPGCHEKASRGKAKAELSKSLWSFSENPSIPRKCQYSISTVDKDSPSNTRPIASLRTISWSFVDIE
jgi:hypothetical protein